MAGCAPRARGPWECRNSNDSRELRGRDGTLKRNMGTESDKSPRCRREEVEEKKMS